MYTAKPIFGRWIKQSIVSCLFSSAMILAGFPAPAADFDLCGCINHPDSLGAFDSADPTTWPPGTEIPKNQNWRMYIPLPEDGVLIFDSFKAERWKGHGNCELWFRPNAANTPVTILVAGDFILKTIDRIKVKGKEIPVTVYSPMHKSELSEEEIRNTGLVNEIMELCFSGSYELALSKIEDNFKHPDNHLSQIKTWCMNNLMI